MKASTSNSNWVCFNCRISIRKPNWKSTNQDKFRCTNCHEHLVDIGYKIGVPKKSDDKGWKHLKDYIRSENITNIEGEIKHCVRVIHNLEKEIKKEESKDFNKDREKQISAKKSLLALEKTKILNIG